MKTAQRSTLALLVAAATLSAGVASAQTTPAPMMGASAPMSRDDVKHDRDTAVKSGTKPMGAADMTKDRPKGDAETKKSASGGKSRDQVKAETKQAAQAGEIPKGAADITANAPKGGVPNKP